MNWTVADEQICGAVHRRQGGSANSTATAASLVIVHFGVELLQQAIQQLKHAFYSPRDELRTAEVAPR